MIIVIKFEFHQFKNIGTNKGGFDNFNVKNRYIFIFYFTVEFYYIRNMGAKDITEKNLEAFNDVFADIVNVLLFKGKNLMNEKDLESAAKDSMFKADSKIHQQERDVSKFWKMVDT